MMTIAGKDVGKGQYLLTVGVTADCCPHYEITVENPQNLRLHLPHDPGTILLELNPQHSRSHYTDTCSNMFIAALVTNQKTETIQIPIN